MPGFAQSDVARFLRRHGLANGTSMPLVDGDGQLIGAAHFSLSDNEVPGYARGLLTRMREDLSEVAQAASQARRSRLTPREIEVLRLLAQGLTNSQVAAQLVISRRTASTHVENILAKLEVAGRLQAAMLASRLGLLG
jgi:DNA-binding NarL/FixJ family response regulator